MPGLTRQSLSAIAIWIGFLIFCAISLVGNLRFTHDLGVFLPSPRTEAQKVLIERLGEGPGSRFLFIGLPNFNDSKLRQIQSALDNSGLFRQVVTDVSSHGFSDIPDIVWRYRYLLSDRPIDETSIHNALAQRLSDMSFVSGAEFNQIITHDPALLSLRIMQDLATVPLSNVRWKTEDGMAVVIAETRASSFDLFEQRSAIQTIRNSVNRIQNLASSEFEISGSGAFGVHLQDTTQSEATSRSLIATLGLLVVLLLAYRRAVYALIAGIPLLSGVLGGLSAVTLVFHEIHGITLAFGFTLLGITIDYPLHFFSHARNMHSTAAIRHVWPTLRLGAASTIIAYAGIGLSGAEGLAQLGLFTSVGLLAAAATTRWLLPSITELTPCRRQVTFKLSNTALIGLLSWPRTILAFALSSAAIFFVWQGMPNGEVWNNALSSLSPVPKEQLLRDHEFRALVGAPDMRYVIALRYGTLQKTLQATEKVNQRLEVAVEHGILGRWQNVSRLLPSDERQLLRQMGLPDQSALEIAITNANTQMPFKDEAFLPFRKEVEASRKLPLLTNTSFRDTKLESFINNHLYRSTDQWVSLTSLYDPVNISALYECCSGNDDGSVLVDLKNASESLVMDYRHHTLKVLVLSLVLIFILLLFNLTKAHAFWAILNVTSIVMATTATVLVLSGSLNIFHMIALLLVAGLGLDYVLFLGRDEPSPQHRSNTEHAVLVCAISTIVVFGLLGLSDVAVLQNIGRTVSIGALFSLLVAYLGSGKNMKAPTTHSNGP
jgi:predicted exporter